MTIIILLLTALIEAVLAGVGFMTGAFFIPDKPRHVIKHGTVTFYR